MASGGRDWIVFFVGVVNRLVEDLERLPPVTVDVGDQDFSSPDLEELILMIEDLIDKFEVLVSREDDEASGIERRCGSVAMIRPEHHDPKPPSSPKPKPRELQPRATAAPGGALQPGQAADGWRNGVVRYFDSMTRTAVVILRDGEAASTELTIGPDVCERSGLTNLSPNMKVRIRVACGPDGRKSVDGLEPFARWNESAAAAEPGGARRVAAIPSNPTLAALERQQAMRERFPGW